MPLFIVAFPNNAPLHRVAVERPARGQRLRVAPTGRAMVHDEVLTVRSAKALAPELARVVSRADPQKPNDHVVRSAQFQRSRVAFAFLDADTITRRRLAGDSQIRLAHYQPFGLDQTPNPEDHRPRTF